MHACTKQLGLMVEIEAAVVEMLACSTHIIILVQPPLQVGRATNLNISLMHGLPTL